jgi:murein DD-endopeptidase MepM/ murein hydrolase activator NlpD
MLNQKKYLIRLAKLFLISLVVFRALALNSSAGAQENKPYYIIQNGDSLWQIAARFGVSVEDLQKANNITDPSQMAIGARIIIPGLSGISGQISTATMPYGETLRGLSRRYGISERALAQLNHIVSPSELYAGARLIVPVTQEISFANIQHTSLTSGQSVLEVAILQGKDPWSITVGTGLPSTSLEIGLPGLPTDIQNVDIDPLQMIQGGTTVIKVYAPPNIIIRGSLVDRTLNFFPQGYGYVALQGVHALTPAGLYPLILEGELPDGKSFTFSQNVLIQDAGFPSDPTLEVDPSTVDPAVTQPEKEMWESLSKPVTAEKMWTGLFANPVPKDLANCWTSLFGTRRSYNGGPYDSFHSGLDFCGQVGTELYAVAPGKVVYTDTLVVRGGVVVIDHGWGVYTAYDHLSQILVQPGDMVEPGQVIGLGGATGRSTGPHLHWEVWVGGVQVNPMDWLTRSFP